MKIACIGTGFVGVVTSAVFASFGHEVIGLDIDQDKIDALSAGEVPFFEPGLKELLDETLESQRLSFTTSYQEAIESAEVIMVMVGTPSAADGQADLKYVIKSSEMLAPNLDDGAIVVIKSTVPPGTNLKIREVISSKTEVNFTVASVPEFLKEGSAVKDTLHPARVLIGANDKATIEKLTLLHQPLTDNILVMKPESAQMAKYASNTYLATRITFINQIADLCQKNGADIEEVISGMGQDPRIGQHYWYPGFGYGGSCFPKDVSELAAYSRAVGEANNLMNKVHELNQERVPRLLAQFGNKIGGWGGKKVAVLGLSFKPNTDDTRQAPSLQIIPQLIEAGAEVRSYDPRASLPKLEEKTDQYQQLTSIEAATKKADIIMAVVEWPQITSFDYSQIKDPDLDQVFIDGRNQFSAEQIEKWGFKYLGIGRT